MSIASDQAVVIWGEVLWDRFPDGARLGGAPANVAWHLGQAGGWARLVSRVGDDLDGRRAIEQLASACDADLVQIDRGRATGEVTVEISNGEPRYTLVPGRAWERIECTADVAAALGEASVLVYGTLSQYTDTGLAGWREAVAASPDSCLKVCDVNLRRTSSSTQDERRAVEEAIAVADVVKVNDAELARIADWFGWHDPVESLRAGKRVVAITHGKAGSTIYPAARNESAPLHLGPAARNESAPLHLGPAARNESAPLHLGAQHECLEIVGVPSRPGGDNVGCGDAYVALLVHGMTLGWDLASSGAAASRWAAAVAGERGATPLFSDEVIDKLLGAAVS